MTTSHHAHRPAPACARGPYRPVAIALRLACGLLTCGLLTGGLLACDSGAQQAAPTPAPAHPPVKPTTEASPALPPGHPPMPGAPGTVEGTVETGTAPAADGAEGAGGLSWSSTAPLVRRPPASRMRAAEYVVAGKATGADAVLTVFYFGAGQGGAVDANIDRWVGQFKTADGQTATRAAAKIDKRDLAGVQVTTIDLSGAFAASMAPMMATQAAEPKSNQRMLGAIAEGPKGPVFFKLVGPSETVGAAESAFGALVASIKPAS